jgi:hypothetical protein
MKNHYEGQVCGRPDSEFGGGQRVAPWSPKSMQQRRVGVVQAGEDHALVPKVKDVQHMDLHVNPGKLSERLRETQINNGLVLKREGGTYEGLRTGISLLFR